MSWRGGRLSGLLRLLFVALLINFDHRSDHQRYGNDCQDGVFHLPCQWQGRILRDQSNIVSVVNQFPNPHLLNVVLERFAAVEADNIRLAALLPYVGKRGHWLGKAAVGATEK
jgi:hypothetical protein